MFEADDRPGGHTRTVDIETDTAAHRVDTGFIVFNDRNYPGFERLLERLGVESQASDMGFSVSDGRGEFEYNGGSINGLFARRSSLVRPSFHRMVRDLLRFNREAPALIGLNGSGPTLLDFLDEGGYSREFVERLIVPQASAVWSADPRDLRHFPASVLAEFFDNHGQFGFRDRPRWRAVAGGSSRYVERLCAPMRERLRLSTPVARVERFDDRVEVTPVGGGPESFDEVILAVHSDQALRMLGDASAAERQILGAIPYQPNEVVLHTDASLLPRRRRAWASWNFHLSDEPVERTTVTYHMNRLQSLTADRQFCVTLNRTEAIDPERVLSVREFSHPVFSHRALTAQRRWDEVSGVRRTQLLRRLLGLRLPRGRRAERAARLRAVRGAPVTELYEGWVRHRRFGDVPRSFRYRLYMTLGDDGVLEMPRSLGVGFNPVRFRYGTDGSLAAEVTNTPWGERRVYSFDGLSGTTGKAMHVSPFLGMDHDYSIHANVPGKHLTVHIENTRDGERVFDATLSLERRPASDLRRLRLRYPAQTLRVLALIYAHGALLALRGAPYHPHPPRAA